METVADQHRTGSEDRMFRCPHCGQLSPVRMACSGSFTDKGHPSSVQMVPVETGGED